MNAPRELPGRAAEIYREHGPRVLALKALGFPKSIALHRGLEFVTRAGLDRRAAERSYRWFEAQETPCRISPVDVPRELGQFAGEYHPEPRFLCEVPDCRLVGDSAVGLLDDRILLDTAGSHYEHFFTAHKDFLGTKTALELVLRNVASRSPSVPERSLPPVLPLVPFYDNYYYPWLVEYLPKLRLIERYEAETGREPVVIVEEDPPSFVRATLALLGYDGRYVEWDGAECTVDPLLVTDHRLATSWAGPRYGFSLSAEDCLWVRDAIRSAVDLPSASSGGKRLYVSRRATDRGRRVANYDEIEPVLDSYGFESYVLESLPFAEQVRLVSDAEVILSPHGAGLANGLFAEDPTVVELFAETLVRPSYYLLSGMLGFEYEPMVVEPVAHDPHDDLLVDPDELSDRLDAVVDDPQ
ncbi:glycosyltransferase family 61 protein [Natronorarus salvus]|uniref:glycosyltransferase family 61 protein n=1 Tax=Natronorarus salvus TaxID=3117733 RepID=UPI002F26749B